MNIKEQTHDEIALMRRTLTILSLNGKFSPRPGITITDADPENHQTVWVNEAGESSFYSYLDILCSKEYWETFAKNMPYKDSLEKITIHRSTHMWHKDWKLSEKLFPMRGLQEMNLVTWYACNFFEDLFTNNLEYAMNKIWIQI